MADNSRLSNSDFLDTRTFDDDDDDEPTVFRKIKCHDFNIFRQCNFIQKVKLEL